MFNSHQLKLDLEEHRGVIKAREIEKEKLEKQLQALQRELEEEEDQIL